MGARRIKIAMVSNGFIVQEGEEGKLEPAEVYSTCADLLSRIRDWSGWLDGNTPPKKVDS